MKPGVVRKSWRRFKRDVADLRTLGYFVSRSLRGGWVGSASLWQMRQRIRGFVDSMQLDPEGLRYRYSASCRVATLYASTYACLIHGLLRTLPEPGSQRRAAWVEYFDSFQRSEDGLFYDEAVACSGYEDSDWWGARHLALHLVNAYRDLGARPRYPFRFLEAYYDDSERMNKLVGWLDRPDEAGGDGDNKIMNIGCLLQYQRDTWGDAAAGRAVDELKAKLLSRVHPQTGMWGQFDTRNKAQLSRIVQVAYHIVPIFLHDRYVAFDGARIVGQVLRLQNVVGGFGARTSASACEDIDAIDVLLAFCSAGRVPPDTMCVVKEAVGRAQKWVRANQMEDGGFVFRLHEPFTYGHSQMSSRANQGAMFPTWFRLLSMGSMSRFLGTELDLALSDCPGYAAMCYRGQ